MHLIGWSSSSGDASSQDECTQTNTGTTTLWTLSGGHKFTSRLTPATGHFVAATNWQTANFTTKLN